MQKVVFYQLPWTAEPAQRQLVAITLLSALRDEMVSEGVKGRVDRFFEEYGGAAGSYGILAAQHFGADIPTPVKGILMALAERISDMKTRHHEMPFTNAISLPEASDLVAKMAVTIADVRALNDILGQ